MTKFKTSEKAFEYLTGLRGIEIGGSAHNAFHLNTINVDYTDDMETTFKKEEIEMCGHAMKVDLVAEGDELPIADKSQDFVISSHVIEHFFDPIKAIKEWQRVAKKYIFMIIPHHERNFDKDRELTTISELVKRFTGKLTPEDYSKETSFGKVMRGHWSVWNPETFKEMCEHFGFEIVEIQDPDDKVGNGFTVILKA